MYCPDCGKEIPDQSKFCFGCGANLKDSLGDIVTQVQSESDLSIDTLSDASTILETAPSSSDAARYEILSSLGKGGMGEVFKAKDKKLGRTVAIKRLLPALSSNEKAFSRFMSEAKALASLNHPNIVHIYDIDEDSEGHYISMEYVEAGSLQDIVKSKGKLEEQDALEVFINICKGLSQAHKKGIIHRDIKPANILITKAGSPKLTDFGIAQMAEAEDMTKTGIAMGTPVYMAPEQHKDAKHVDHRADIYSLGATLYEILTGYTPRVIKLDKVPERFREMLSRMLEDLPEMRYADIGEVLKEMAKLKAVDEKDSERAVENEGEVLSEQYTETDDDPGMVLVKGGEFEMGDTFGDGYSNEEPLHKVSVDDFYIGKYSVTFDEYDQYCEDTGAEKPDDQGWGRGRRPVINVSWDDAQEYIKWLNKKSGGKYRFPTEAEWEYVARSGGRKEKYAGTGDESELKDYAWYIGNSGGKTHPVGQKSANGLGIYDMSGNVFEWLSDWYGEYSGGKENNPTGPGSGSGRVLRGGGWDSCERRVRCSRRVNRGPGDGGSDLGFRLARTK